VLETLHVHQPEHPGFLRLPLEGREVGVDGGRGPAGVAQQLGDCHHVMAPKASPAAGIERSGTQHAGDDVQERGHGLPAAGRIEGKQVGSCRADWGFPPGQRRQKTFIRRNDCRRREQFRFIIRHQCHPGLRQGRKPPGALREKSGQMVRILS